MQRKTLYFRRSSCTRPLRSTSSLSSRASHPRAMSTTSGGALTCRLSAGRLSGPFSPSKDQISPAVSPICLSNISFPLLSARNYRPHSSTGRRRFAIVSSEMDAESQHAFGPEIEEQQLVRASQRQVGLCIDIAPLFQVVTEFEHVQKLSLRCPEHQARRKRVEHDNKRFSRGDASGVLQRLFCGQLARPGGDQAALAIEFLHAVVALLGDIHGTVRTQSDARWHLKLSRAFSPFAPGLFQA